jgi:hypothetical protein
MLFVVTACWNTSSTVKYAYSFFCSLSLPYIVHTIPIYWIGSCNYSIWLVRFDIVASHSTRQPWFRLHRSNALQVSDRNSEFVE